VLNESQVPKKPVTSGEPTPSDFAVLNQDHDSGLLADANIELDDSWDLLISNGEGEMGSDVSGGGGGTDGK
jgi:hypothetical protein